MKMKESVELANVMRQLSPPPTVILVLVAMLPTSVRGQTPDLEANKAVVERVIEEVQRKGDFIAFEQLFDDTYIDHTAFPGFASDKAGTRAIYEAFRAAFPDFRATTHRQVAEGDLVTTHKTYHGTHLGPFMGSAPTGRLVTFDVIDIMRVKAGRIADHWGATDTGAIMRQIEARAPEQVR